MNHSDPTPDGFLDDEEKALPRALGPGREDFAAPSHSSPASASASTSSSLRGEIFDVIIGGDGEIQPQSAARKSGAPWFLAGLAALFCAYSLGAYVNQKSKAPAPTGPFVTKNQGAAPLRVQVVGLVKKPGVYTLTKGARIDDALQKAGGPLAGADLSALNLADWAADGSKIEVPAKVRAAPVLTPTPRIIIKKVFITLPQNTSADSSADTSETENRNLREAVAEKSGSTSTPTLTLKRGAKPGLKRVVSGAKSETKTAAGGKSSEAALNLLRKNPVDLNRASAEQLATLPGVGPKMAERILAYRQENGGFKSIEDLDNVRGIGEKRMEILRDLVKVK